MTEVFDEEESPVLGTAELEAVPPEAWEEARLRPISAFRLLSFKTVVIPNLVAYHEDRPSPGPRRRASWLALYRRDYSVLRLELTRAEYDLLTAIADGVRPRRSSRDRRGSKSAAPAGQGFSLVPDLDRRRPFHSDRVLKPAHFLKI